MRPRGRRSASRRGSGQGWARRSAWPGAVRRAPRVVRGGPRTNHRPARGVRLRPGPAAPTQHRGSDPGGSRPSPDAPRGGSGPRFHGARAGRPPGWRPRRSPGSSPAPTAQVRPARERVATRSPVAAVPGAAPARWPRTRWPAGSPAPRRMPVALTSSRFAAGVGHHQHVGIDSRRGPLRSHVARGQCGHRWLSEDGRRRLEHCRRVAAGVQHRQAGVVGVGSSERGHQHECGGLIVVRSGEAPRRRRPVPPPANTPRPAARAGERHGAGVAHASAAEPSLIGAARALGARGGSGPLRRPHAPRRGRPRSMGGRRAAVRGARSAVFPRPLSQTRAFGVGVGHGVGQGRLADRKRDPPVDSIFNRGGGGRIALGSDPSDLARRHA